MMATLSQVSQYLQELIRKMNTENPTWGESGQLNIHADRGRVMTSKPFALLMADLGVTKTHSRPYVSDDNPHSESEFRTMKYRPKFPDRFVRRPPKPLPLPSEVWINKPVPAGQKTKEESQ
jgi:transposase InsO family protein